MLGLKYLALYGSNKIDSYRLELVSPDIRFALNDSSCQSWERESKPERITPAFGALGPQEMKGDTSCRIRI